MGVLAVGFHIFNFPFLLIAIIASLLKTDETKRIRFTDSLWKLNAVLIILSLVTAIFFQVLSLPRHLVPILPSENYFYWFLSIDHIVNVLNQLLLIAPLGIVVFLFYGWRKSDNESYPIVQKLLALLSLMLFLEVFWVNPHLGAPRDWDLLSFLGFPFSIWAAYFLYHKHLGEYVRAKHLVAVLVIASICIVPNLIEKNDLHRATVHLDKMLWGNVHYQENVIQANRSYIWGYMLAHTIGEY